MRNLKADEVVIFIKTNINFVFYISYLNMSSFINMDIKCTTYTMWNIQVNTRISMSLN